MRLFKSKKSDKNGSSRPETPAGDAEAGNATPAEGTGGSYDAAAGTTQQQDRSSRVGRGMNAVMNRPPRQLTEQEMVQESIGEVVLTSVAVEIHAYRLNIYRITSL